MKPVAPVMTTFKNIPLILLGFADLAQVGPLIYLVKTFSMTG